ncbi:prevent-host-death protein [Spirochaetia bacterium]|nr:prevent-host-death protein [Spirochaetia bacterium]
MGYYKGMINPVIKPSSELRKNYNTIAEICRTGKVPVFLTRNGEGDTVLMDMETYSRREEDLIVAERLMDAERRRMAGEKGYTIEELEESLTEAIKLGAAEGKKDNAQYV